MDVLKTELEVLSRWKLRPEHDGLRLFEDLARAEYFDPLRIELQVDQSLRRILAFAAQHIPFYKKWFATRKIPYTCIQCVANLLLLPVVTKGTLIVRGMEFHPSALRASEQAGWTAYLSGTSENETASK